MDSTIISSSPPPHYTQPPPQLQPQSNKGGVHELLKPLWHELIQAAQSVQKRAPLDAKYKRLLMNGRVTTHRPVFPKKEYNHHSNHPTPSHVNKSHSNPPHNSNNKRGVAVPLLSYKKQVKSNLRARAEQFHYHEHGRNHHETLLRSDLHPEEEAAMRAAWTLRDAKEHEQAALLEASVRFYNQNQHQHQNQHTTQNQNQQYWEGVAQYLISLKDNDPVHAYTADSYTDPSSVFSTSLFSTTSHGTVTASASASTVTATANATAGRNHNPNASLLMRLATGAATTTTTTPTHITTTTTKKTTLTEAAHPPPKAPPHKEEDPTMTTAPTPTPTTNTTTTTSMTQREDPQSSSLSQISVDSIGRVDMPQQQSQPQSQQQQRIALHQLYRPIFTQLWNMEFPHLGHTNPFRMVMDADHCAAVGAPDYFDIIDTPMNLTYIQGKVEARAYDSLASFTADVDLMLRNALVYNSDPANPYHIAAQEMKKRYVKMVKKVVQSISIIPSQSQSNIN